MKPARLVDFLFETQMLKRTPRSGYQFLGQGRESVAEHSYGAVMLAFVLARLMPEADLEKLIKLTLFHDLAEARTGDMNYMNKRYVRVDERGALDDAVRGLSFGLELAELWTEWEKAESLEARLARDADQLDMILELRRQQQLGSQQAGDWIHYAEKRLRTPVGRELCREIAQRDPDAWWFEKRDDYWVLNN